MSQSGSFNTGGEGPGGTDLHVAAYIVNSNFDQGGNFATIASAITAAVATGQPSTIFIMPGTTGIYTENITLPPGINLAAFDCDAIRPNVTIVGKISMTGAGHSVISGIRLQTNSDFVISISGTLGSQISLLDCYINATNNNAISMASSSSSTGMLLRGCRGNLGTTGFNYFNIVKGRLDLDYCSFDNNDQGSGSPAANIVSGSASVNLLFTEIQSPITTSGTASLVGINSRFSTENSTSLTLGGTGTNIVNGCTIESGTASSISVGAGATVSLNTSAINSSNANAITGAGTVKYAGIEFFGSSSTVNTTTQTPLTSFLVPVSYTTDGVAYFDGKKLTTTIAGDAGQTLTSNGSGVAPTYQTTKSPVFSQVGTSGTSAVYIGEFVTAAVTRTLPASAGLVDGDLFIYVCTTANALVIQSVTAQKIRLGNTITSAAGTATSTAIGDSITLRFNATDGFFYAVASVGNWTLSP